MRTKRKSHRLANAALATLTRLLALLPGGRRAATPESILVVRLGNVGDIVVAIPAFHALRKAYPSAQLTLLTSPTQRGAPGAAEVLVNDPTFDDCIVYYEDESQRPGFLKGLRVALRAKRVDCVVILPNHLMRFSSALKFLALAAASGVRRVAGCRLVTHADYERKQVDRLLALLRPLGADAAAPFPWVRPTDTDRQRVADLLGAHADAPLVGIHCGAKRPANRWPEDRFAELGRRLATEKGLVPVLTGSAGEADLTARVASALGQPCVDLAGKTSLTELAALAQRCRVFVTNDTGAMHLAYAAGTPVVAVFGGRFFPHIWYPYGEESIVVRQAIACSPCHQEICPLYEVPECLTRISTEEVFAAVETILDRERRP